MDWGCVKLGSLIEGLDAGTSVTGIDRPAESHEVGVLKVSAVSQGKFKPYENKAILSLSEIERATGRPKKGCIIISRSNSPELVGDAALVDVDTPNLYLPDKLWQARTAGEEIVCERWLLQALLEPRMRLEMKNRASGTSQSMKNISKESLLTIPVALPPLPEQRKIADILSTWDEALTQLDALIEAQERRKKALMQQLLTGRRRLKGFDQSKGKTASDRFGIYPADWKRVRLGEITNEVPTKNAEGTDLPVLSCTKHRGLVLSQEYFGKRVYAEDTSGYRLVQRGEFAYATNHIEEGSIGYQNICDAGLVSPIYTVFKTTEAVDDSYLFRVLKSPLLIHFYQINTSASVDRRGSLRYDEFSRIHIWLPGKEEQTAIAQVFDTADQQLTLLRTQRSALDQQKRGLMQRLLTGKLRVKQ